MVKSFKNKLLCCMREFIFILIYFLFTGTLPAQYGRNLWQPFYITPRTGNQHIDLSGTWDLSYTDNQITSITDLKNRKDHFETQVPNSIQWSYYKAGKLPHPYEHKNSAQYKWLEKKVWYYQKDALIPQSAKGKIIMLCFDGIDYFSKVWVNDTLTGVHEGMFGGPDIDISSLVKCGENNRIIIEVRAGNWGNVATDFDSLPRSASGKYDLSKINGYIPKKSGRIIKPWSLAGGPAGEPFFSVGMWQGVRIEILPDIHLERPYLITSKILQDEAHLHLSLEVLAGTTSLKNQFHTWKEAQVIISGEPKDNIHIPVEGKTVLVIELLSENSVKYKKEITLNLYKGRNWLEEDLVVKNPELWNPVGLGNPELYRVRLSLLKTDKTIDRIEFDYGIRTIEQIPSAGPRTADIWTNWQFVVNGKKIFVKGMNWVPADLLLDLSEERYLWALQAAKNMGVQLIRVWGGGILETEKFYDICNNLGIMVWQDFPIGNQDTPEFPKDIWEAQIVQNIFRLRNQPCLAVWCGGNEFNPYSSGNAASIGILERNLEIFDKSRLFLRADPDDGSLHTYPDMDPCWYNRLYKFTPWITETGFASMPEANLFYEVVDNKELKDIGKKKEIDFFKSHPEFMHHVMKYDGFNPDGLLKLASHIDDMPNSSFETITEATQVGSGEFYQILSEKMQANYPVTTGLMPWVFKRHWAYLQAHQMMDWFGQPTAQYYFLKRTYESTHISLDLERLLWAPDESMKLSVRIINAIKAFSGKASVTVYNDTFQPLFSKEVVVNTDDGPSVTASDFGEFRIPDGYRNRYLFIVAELKSNTGELISRSVYNPRCLEQMEDKVFHDKYMNEPVPWITMENGPWLKPDVAKTQTRLNAELISQKVLSADRSQLLVKVTNTGKVPSFITKLNIEGIKRAFVADDNYYWLAPGESREISVEVLWREEKTGRKIVLASDSWNSRKQIIKLK
jgi:beta-mannosidase